MNRVILGAEDRKSASQEKDTVLVVDDELINRKMLRGLLEAEGYLVEEGSDGDDAIRLARSGTPGCILLDLFMPNRDGLDACRVIKEDPQTAAIPVIVITAHKDRSARLDAISAGADDFLAKPYDPQEVLLRVKNSIRVKRLYDQAQQDLRRLQELEQTKESLTHMLIHDLRQPLTGIKAYSDYMSTSINDETRATIGDFLLRISQLVESAESMVANVLDITRLEEARMPIERSPHDIKEVLSGAIENAQPAAAREKIRIEFAPSSGEVFCDRELVRRVAENLISNAVKHSKTNGVVEIGVEDQEQYVAFYVKDHGVGIPPEFHQLVFEKYGQVEMRTKGTQYSSGLGLAFCRLAVEANGGTITLESKVDNGATFRVRIPKSDRNELRSS